MELDILGVSKILVCMNYSSYVTMDLDYRTANGGLMSDVMLSFLSRLLNQNALEQFTLVIPVICSVSQRLDCIIGNY